jgi:hypothetical protein
MIFKEFKTIIFDACTALNAVVISLYEGGITPNFHVAQIRKNDVFLFVLCSYDNHWAYSRFFSTTECKLDFSCYARNKNDFLGIKNRQL